MLKKIGEKLKGLIEISLLYRLAACFICGAIAAIGSVLGIRSVHIVCLAAAFPSVFGAASIAGAALSMAVSGFTANSAAVLASSVCILLLRELFDDKSIKKYPAAASAAAAAALFFGAGLALVIQKSPFSDYFRLAAACMAAAYAVYYSASVFRAPFGLKSVSSDFKKLLGLSVFSVSVLSFASAGGVSAGMVLGIFLSVVFTYRSDRQEALAAAAAMSLGLLISGTKDVTAILLIPAIPALCPTSAKRKKAALCLFAVLISAVFPAVFSESGIFGAAVSAAAASLIFFAVPARAMPPFADKKASLKCRSGLSEERLAVISGGLDKIFGSLPKESAPASLSVGDAVYAGVCIDCEKYSECFKDSSDEAQSALAVLDETDSGSLNLSMRFCAHRSEVLKCASDTVRRKKYLCELKKDAEKNIRSFGSMIYALGRITYDMSCCGGMPSVDRQAEQRLVEELSKEGIRPAGCFFDCDGCAELYFPHTARINTSKLMSLASKALGTKMCESFLFETESVSRLVMTPKPNYHFEAGVCQLAKEAGGYPGDCTVLWNQGRLSLLAISDGMGTGIEAKKHSELLSGILKQLIEAGMSIDAALIIASEYLKNCFSDEGFATLDILSADVFSGETHIYKCGAGKSYIVENGDISLVPGGGYPLGIIDELSFRHISPSLSDESVIVMLTDGADFLSPDTIKELVLQGADSGCFDIAAGITRAALNLCGKNSRDDITAAVVRIKKSC